jgi:hypothetical protein
MREYRPYSALFTSSPGVQAFAAYRKTDSKLYVLSTSEYDPETHRVETRTHTIKGHWDAARWAVAHTEKTHTLVTAFEDGKPDEPLWRTVLRPGNRVAIGAYGASENRSVDPRKRHRARRSEVDMSKARASDPALQPRTEPLAADPPLYTAAQKRAAIEHLFTPRLVTVEDTQQAKTSTDAKAREEKARLIADFLRPKLT